MNNKPGFSVLELVMVMAVSAVVMTSLFEIYNQVMNNAARVERYIAQDSQILTVQSRLYKDFMAMSAIWFTQADLDQKRAAQNSSDDPTAPQAGSEQQQKKSSRYFYSCNKQGNLDLLTFVTTSALQSYNQIQDRYVRVVYKLEPDVQHPGNFRLMRKEITQVSEYIDDVQLQAGRFYELAHNIASLQITYYGIDQQAEKKEQQGAVVNNDKKNKAQLKSAPEWKEEKKEKNKDEKKSDQSDDGDGVGQAVMPKIIEMKISFGVLDDPAARQYTLSFCIPSSIDNIVKMITKSSAAPTVSSQDSTIIHS